MGDKIRIDQVPIGSKFQIEGNIKLWTRDMLSTTDAETGTGYWITQCTTKHSIWVPVDTEVEIVQTPEEWAEEQLKDTKNEEVEKQIFIDSLTSPVTVVHISEDGIQRNIEPRSEDWYKIYESMKGCKVDGIVLEKGDSIEITDEMILQHNKILEETWQAKLYEQQVAEKDQKIKELEQVLADIKKATTMIVGECDIAINHTMAGILTNAVQVAGIVILVRADIQKYIIDKIPVTIQTIENDTTNNK